MIIFKILFFMLTIPFLIHEMTIIASGVPQAFPDKQLHCYCVIVPGS